jgi:hypothetical protein
MHPKIQASGITAHHCCPLSLDPQGIAPWFSDHNLALLRFLAQCSVAEQPQTNPPGCTGIYRQCPPQSQPQFGVEVAHSPGKLGQAGVFANQLNAQAIEWQVSIAVFGFPGDGQDAGLSHDIHGIGHSGGGE